MPQDSLQYDSFDAFDSNYIDFKLVVDTAEPDRLMSIWCGHKDRRLLANFGVGRAFKHHSRCKCGLKVSG